MNNPVHGAAPAARAAARGARAAARAAARGARADRTFTQNSVRLAYRDYGGPGPPVLLLHGLAGYGGEWEAVARRLRPAWRVVTLDQRGHGASERRPAAVSRASYVADVVALIQELDLSPVVLAGQSLGGHTAMLVAAQRPAMVRALVLAEAGPGGPDTDGPARVGRWLDSWPVPFTSADAAVEFFGGGRAGRGWAAGLQACADGWRPRFDRDVMVESLAENARRSYWPEWQQVRCPTLLVRGEHGIIPPEHASEMVRRGRAVTVVADIPGAGHDVHLENPAAIARAMREFLRVLPAR